MRLGMEFLSVVWFRTGLVVRNWRSGLNLSSRFTRRVSLAMSSDSRNVWILPDELLERTPSRDDGISMDSEIVYRHNTCRFILEIGKHFKG